MQESLTATTYFVSLPPSSWMRETGDSGPDWAEKQHLPPEIGREAVDGVGGLAIASSAGAGSHDAFRNLTGGRGMQVRTLHIGRLVALNHVFPGGEAPSPLSSSLWCPAHQGADCFCPTASGHLGTARPGSSVPKRGRFELKWPA